MNRHIYKTDLRMDDNIAQFTAITNCDPAKAQRYLTISENDLEQALQLFFEGGIDVDGPEPSNTSDSRNSATGTRPESPINIDDDDDFRAAIEASTGGGPSGDFEDDEAIARRLQEEFNTSTRRTADEVRAPMARTTETLVGPDDMYTGGYGVNRRGGCRFSRACGRSMLTCIPVGRRPPRGIFNQQASSSVWNNVHDSESERSLLAESTGGASEQSTKATRLAQMFRPPYEIMSSLSFEDARQEAREVEKWILVNIQDAGVFQCQTLNRDIWKAKEVVETVKENFIFLQYDRLGTDGLEYLRLYLPAAIDIPSSAEVNPFPHIAIIDPRTGEQVKLWTETPTSPLDFVMDLHEFLGRYSLNEDAKNPIQTKAKAKVDFDHMTEEEQLEYVMRMSSENGASGSHARGQDPDQLTRSDTGDAKGKRKKDADIDDTMLVSGNGGRSPKITRSESAKSPTPEPAAAVLDPNDPSVRFATISSSNSHTEPAASEPNTTRIQFRFPDASRVVRRFSLNDQVVRIYEWLKADYVQQKFGCQKAFDLSFLGKNLIEVLDQSIQVAGLRNGSIMVEFTSEDD
jgi:UBX domain-containing protein 7